MFEKKLLEIVNHIASRNPAFEGNGYLLTRDSDFKGITPDLKNYVYARLESEEGDKTIRLEPFEDSCRMYNVEYDIKIVLATVCCVPDLIAVIISQLGGINLTITSLSEDTEAIYEAETGEKLKRTDLQLYAIYATCEEVVHVNKLANCAPNACITVEQCC